MIGAVALAATLVVWPGQSLEAALQHASDGDTVEIVAGQHHGQVGTITQRRLTVRGVGGRPVLHADGRHAQGKAILVVRDGDVRIENIEFRGTRVPDGNGAGIRFERGRLHVQGCAFFDNQNGILTANYADAELTVRDSEFGQAPAGVSLPHLLYVGAIARFTLSGSRFSGGRDGHLVKSRARVNEVHYNHLVDGAAGRASYELEFPNGGLAFVVGNVVGQSAGSSNPTLVAYGAEGALHGEPPSAREHGLYMAHNTLMNEGLRPAYFVRVHADKLRRPVPQQLVNNLFLGLGVADVQWGDITRGNFPAALSVLNDYEAGDFGLSRHAWLHGRGVAPGSARGRDLAPQAAFTLPAGTRPLTARERWSPGAYQD